MAFLEIGASAGSTVAVKTPSEFQVTILDLDSEKSTRNANGNLVRTRIAIKRKISVTFPPTTIAEMQTILTALHNGGATSFFCKYLDPMLGITTKEFYVGDRVAPLYNNVLGRWDKISMEFIEL
ncbi:DUF6711 family protein [Bacillus sp. UNCCL81]|uniref:DUF6711 family protein n=1 Tax=Bacillus sp. UNCCL81 TaxID=1502755 RepID=UPI0008E43FAD|nr:DUF6711 family protein [Bacillus sp. UNCCL81]SFC52121.1 hypothetical protein SAMN02799633_01078 [Bacillus sp. UNCCL81]